MNIIEKIITLLKYKFSIDYYIKHNKLDEVEIKKLINKFNIVNDYDKLDLLIENQKMSDDFIKYNIINKSSLNLSPNKTFMHNLLIYQDLSEEFIENYYNCFSKTYIYVYKGYMLSEEFIEKHLHVDYLSNLDYFYIPKYCILSESFIEKYIYKFSIRDILIKQILSENFIDKYFKLFTKNNANTEELFIYQKMSEEFIESHFNKSFLKYILINQKVSTNFIKKHLKYIDQINMLNILKFQKLDDQFIEEVILNNKKYKNKNIIKELLKYQNISSDLIDKYIYIFKNFEELYIYNKGDKYLNDIQTNYIPILNNIKNNWMYASTEFKKQQIIDSELYECYDDYFIAYKAIRRDRYSLYNFQYKYEVGQTYESNCDCTNDENSFGLNVGTYEFAKDYCGNNSIIVKCELTPP